MFIDKFNKKQKFLFNEPIQFNYLKICMDGAKDFGEDVYKMFLDTTFINEFKLKDVKKMRHLL